MKKKELTQEEINTIIVLHQNGKSNRVIAKEINSSTSVIERILYQSGNYVFNDNTISIKKQINDDYTLICKKTNLIFEDIHNKSGIITNHIKKEYPDFKIETAFKRRKYESIHGKKWYADFFDIGELKIDTREKFKCDFCDWTTIDLDNKSGWFTTHLKKEHNIDIKKYIKQYPEKSFLFKTEIDKIKKQEYINNAATHNSVICKICGEKFLKISGTHLKKHNISLEDYKYNYGKTITEDTRKFMSEKMSDLNKVMNHTFVSKAEINIKNFLENFNIKIISSDKKLLNGTEIDIICHDKKIGIEYNGNRYHTETFGRGGMFHLNKTKLMNEKGYGLIHIFEDEWEIKQEIVKSKLKHIFGLNHNLKKIYARKCEIKSISFQQKESFLENFHIQGNDNSSFFYGAFYENKLIAVMTFDDKRSMNSGKKEGIFELKRFATDINYQVVGIAGKIIKHFTNEHHPSKIISFADIRWTINKEKNLYTNIGFKISKILAPDYKYYNPKIFRHKRLHKFQFGKKSLKIKFPDIYSNEKTEWEIMKEAGYDRIWDCGKIRYELLIK